MGGLESPLPCALRQLWQATCTKASLRWRGPAADALSFHEKVVKTVRGRGNPGLGAAAAGNEAFPALRFQLPEPARRAVRGLCVE